MSTQYAGDTTFKEMAGAKGDTDIYGVESLVRTYEGRTSLWEEWKRNNLVAEKPDSEFKHLGVASWAPDHGRAFTRVAVTFKGVPSTGIGGITKPQYKTSLKRETVTLKKPNGDSMMVFYYSPTTTITYASADRPKAPRFRGKMLNQDLGLKVYKTTGKKWPISFSRAVVNRPDGAAEPFYWASKEILLSDFTCDQSGLAWTVTEENQLFMIDGHDLLAGTTIGSELDGVDTVQQV